MTGTKTAPRCPHPKKFSDLVQVIVGDDFHAKRVESLANAVIGCAHTAQLGVRAIGVGLAAARGLQVKHAIKQVDRLLSNDALRVSELLNAWVYFRLKDLSAVTVAMDWTEFEEQDHTTLSISIVSAAGRAEPLYWKTFVRSETRGNRVGWEKECIEQFRSFVPKKCQSVHFVADRGFGGVETQNLLDSMGFTYTIRIRNNVQIESAEGQTKKASEWAPKNGNARTLRNALITGQHYPVAAVIVKHAAEMKEPWTLATNSETMTGSSAVKIYGRRFTCEEMFRDIKDPRFGMGLLNSRIKDLLRRDRLLWISTIAQCILTLLGKAGEETGLDRRFRADTRKKREYSFFKQGTMYYAALPTMRSEWAVPLMQRFDQLIEESGLLQPLLGLYE